MQIQRKRRAKEPSTNYPGFKFKYRNFLTSSSAVAIRVATGSKTANPAARAGACRALETKAVFHAPDEIKSTDSREESRAVQVIAARYRVSLNHARVICELASIGENR